MCDICDQLGNTTFLILDSRMLRVMVPFDSILCSTEVSYASRKSQTDY